MLFKSCQALVLGLLIFGLAAFTVRDTAQGDSAPRPYRQNLRAHVLTQRDVPVYTYKIIATYPHDETSFTQGLLINDGYLYEGTGRYRRSKLLKIRLRTGEVLKQLHLAPRYFGEGIAIIDTRIFQLTWKSNIGFVYDKTSFERKGSFRYPTQGWGLTTDGKELIMSNGSASLTFFDPGTMEKTREITVRDHRGKVGYLNELEYIRGEIYANIWTTDLIARISPETGLITGWIDLTCINPAIMKLRRSGVLNGIAFNKETGALIITGKCWPRLYEIALVPVR